MTWCQDKKEVYFLSTIHQAKSAPSEKILKKIKMTPSYLTCVSRRLQQIHD